MENFLYKCIYDVLRNTYPHGQKMIMVNSLKAKITSLHGDKLQRVMLDNDELNRLAGERPALLHILQMRKRQETRTIRSIQDEYENTQQTMIGIVRDLRPSCDVNMNQSQWMKSVSRTWPKQGSGLYRRLGEICWNSPSHWRKYTSP